jgi:hypothetical protein
MLVLGGLLGGIGNSPIDFLQRNDDEPRPPVLDEPTFGGPVPNETTIGYLGVLRPADDVALLAREQGNFLLQFVGEVRRFWGIPARRSLRRRLGEHQER